jgi:predicted ATPase
MKKDSQTRGTSASLRYTQVRLENWRNFVSAEVKLQRRVFLVGPNASGKSNFLDVFRFLHDLVSIGGGFQEAVRQRGGVSSLRCLAARRYSDVAVRVNIGNDETPSQWRYELCFSQDKLRRPVIKEEVVSRQGRQILRRPDPADGSDPERLTQTYLEQVNANQDFRDVADFFASTRYLHIVPQLIREPDRSVGKKNDPFGGDFLEQIARTPEKTRNAWLRRIREALTLAVPQMKELELWRDLRGTPHLRGKYEHWRPQGAWQTEERFSDGTLRLLGLLWIALAGNGPLLVEEPELNLHPEVIRYLPQMFARVQRRSGRQIMICSHSPDLLRDEGIGVDELLLLEPQQTEGTTIRTAGSVREIVALLAGGLPLAEAVIPRTAPKKAQQLTFFGD